MKSLLLFMFIPGISFGAVQCINHDTRYPAWTMGALSSRAIVSSNPNGELVQMPLPDYLCGKYQVLDGPVITQQTNNSNPLLKNFVVNIRLSGKLAGKDYEVMLRRVDGNYFTAVYDSAGPLEGHPEGYADMKSTYESLVSLTNNGTQYLEPQYTPCNPGY